MPSWPGPRLIWLSRSVPPWVPDGHPGDRAEHVHAFFVTGRLMLEHAIGARREIIELVIAVVVGQVVAITVPSELRKSICTPESGMSVPGS